MEDMNVTTKTLDGLHLYSRLVPFRTSSKNNFARKNKLTWPYFIIGIAVFLPKEPSHG